MRGRRGRVARRAVAALAVLGLSSSLSVTGAPPGAGGTAAAGQTGQTVSGSPGGGTGTWVTLLTSDRVLVADVNGDLDAVSSDPGPGRDGMGFHRYEDRGHDYVVPLDAAPLLGRNQLDRRLFEVSTLARFGYDDRSRADLPLIVSAPTTASAATDAARHRLAAAGATPTNELESVGAVAAVAAKARTGELWEQLTSGAEQATPDGGANPPDARLAPELTRIWLDGPVQLTVDESVPQVGAPAAWSAGHTGQGATVAVLDSGIDRTHPDLADAVVGSQDFTGMAPDARDGNGHGTHVASIITGSGAMSGGRYAGVAPDAGLLVGKVVTDAGFGQVSWAIEGMEWAAAQDADVVNMSLGYGVDDGTGILDQAVDNLTATTGTLYVVSAGNGGPAAESVTTPGSADAALTVGAVDDDDRLAELSSRGPRWNRSAIKPDLTAPGVGIVAAQASGAQSGEPVVPGYTRLSGTSMAAPHVAGAAAILSAEHPDWQAEQLKGVLVGSAAPQPGATVYGQGAGRLDVARADTQPLWATPAAISHGVVPWPHDDDQPMATPVTYRNAGATQVTLDVTPDVVDPSGAAAPDGMFTVSADQVTVPAGGEATVVVTTDTAVAGPDGLYQGRLTARDATGRVAVQTPIAVTREVESYDLTLQVLDRTGAPTQWYDIVLADVDAPEGRLHRPYDPSGTVTIRLPRGTYFLDAGIGDAGTVSPSTSLIEPSLRVTTTATLVLDARQARPVGATVDRQNAAMGRIEVLAERQRAAGTLRTGLAGEELYARPSDTAAPAGQFTFSVEAHLARPDGAGGFAGSPYLDHVHWSQDGEVPLRLVRHVADDELVVVRSTYAAASSIPTVGERDAMVTFPLPGRLTERFSPGMPWPRGFTTSSEAGLTSQLALVRSFELGQRYRERWNEAVFGPMDASTPAFFGPQLLRSGDVICASIPLFSDRPDHYSFSMTDALPSLSLTRDGQQYVSIPNPCGSAFPGVPPDEGSYRLATSATRRVFDLSTRVDVAWTFRSAFVPELQPLPLLSVRFAPRLDDHNRAPSGQRFSFPLHVGRHPDASYGTLDSLAVEVSYDDGQTWRPAGLSGSGDDRTVTVVHPDGPGHVSLRVHAGDTAGNGIDQTIIHAYALA
jgi:subtilisin family serine protease